MSLKTTVQAERRRRGRAIRKQRRLARTVVRDTGRLSCWLSAVAAVARDAVLRFAEACALTARAVRQALTTPVSGGELPRPRPRPRALDRPERR